MNSNVDLSSAENLNEALRLYRRLVLGIGAIAVIGFVAVILLAKLGTALSPPYGIYIFGEGLGTWGLIAVVAALVAQVWWHGRAIGKLLNDPALKSEPAVGLMSAPTVIAQRAHAMGMEWSGFFGPLRPAKKRR
ncbi:hypothetical protein X769_21225 [Mesorhizobium sp. LSJC268A00]|uniref:hypothetical protein n=1 Tax=unclassified Mesorhizobium TaxID=325217 RepID=UPI0003CE6451|nr:MULTISPECIES: hypothetical protein [unclassified Mesorhizobium]ESW79052.1 hypothetical protein X773_18390 [Mesorhizobium sp. LSJC285A00]ESX00421.1 hypothetical protein X769_21225 [Mesorhizobium sp. LSJC268A00]ESX24385.1 hypothetical protein X767_12230 [Mesorhizobium sp. LSJC264A00]ESX45565.1 hypothetical protein X762_25700 [Mesorhizobium sp. LSHC426A00]ESX57099.1 hypothetical protein X761_05030 [Mesorhizobium sp. LSHC424B00]